MSTHLDSSKLPAYGTLLLRSALGLILLAHGILKVHNLPGTAEYFSSLGLPSWLAFPVSLVELFAGLSLVIGLKTRWAALAALPVLIGATWVHAGNGWLFSGSGGGWEFPALLIVVALVQALVGDGAYSVSQLQKFIWRRSTAAV